MQYLHLDYPFPLEAGQYLEKLTIAYTTHGQRNAEGNNVVWVCHAFTGDANPLGWWPGLIGAGRLLDPQKYFIVCANIIGSCYGTTGPDHYQPGTGVPYGLDFPTVTIRDMVQAHERLREHLGIRRIRLAIGGSMGGQQVAEWAVANPSIFDKICILAANARHSPWGIAFNETQRMALLADNSLGTAVAEAGRKVSKQPAPSLFCLTGITKPTKSASRRAALKKLTIFWPAATNATRGKSSGSVSAPRPTGR